MSRRDRNKSGSSTRDPSSPDVTQPPSRLRAALLATAGFGVVLGVACSLTAAVTPVTGPDAPGELTVAMVVASVAGFLAVLLRLPGTERAAATVLLPAVGAAVAFLLAGVVLFGLGSGDPLRGPAFALSQFGHPGIYFVVALAVAAAGAYRMGTSPHRHDHTRRVG